MSPKRLAIAALVAIVGSFAPAVAFACSCGFPPFEALTGDLVPENAEVPIILNEGEMTFIEVEGPDGWTELGLLEDNVVATPDEEWDARLDIEWSEGERYRFVRPIEGADPALEGEFTIGPPVAASTNDIESAVTVESGDYSYYSDSASCDVQTPSRYAQVDLELPKDLEPYAESIIWEQRVDGTEYRHVDGLCASRDFGTERGLAGFRLAAPCEPSEYGDYPEDDYRLSASTHTVSYYGYIPGTDVTLTADGVEVDLECDGAAGPIDDEADRGCSSAGGGSVSALALLALLGLVRRRRDGDS